MNIETLLQQAVAHLQQGQLDQAESGLEKILIKQPKHIDANHLQGVIAARRGQYKRAVKLINRAIKRAPQQPVFFNNLGHALYNSGQLEKAMLAFQQVIKLDPYNIGAYYSYGNIQQDLGNLEAALATFDQVIQLKPQYAEAHNNRAVILGGLGRMEDALLSCDQAIKINPQYAVAYYNQGNALNALGQLEEALAAYDHAIHFKPDYAEAHSNRGNILFTLEQTMSALEAYKMTIQLKPTLPEVHNNLGNVLIKLGQLPEAIKALETELRLNPNSTSAEYLLATLGEKSTPQHSPQEYVSRLFNNCADRFDERLVETLGYNAPQQLFNAVSILIDPPSKKLDIIDLGCGTGLCGVAFAELSNRLTGVDLAERMIEKAKERGLYTDLIQADVCQALEQEEGKFDLILSGDVFIYIGKLNKVFALASKRLNPGGLFAFSIEVNESGEDYKLRQSGRYAQSPEYIQRLADANRLEQISYLPDTLRYEYGEPIAGSVIVLRLPIQGPVS